MCFAVVLLIDSVFGCDGYVPILIFASYSSTDRQCQQYDNSQSRERRRNRKKEVRDVNKQQQWMMDRTLSSSDPDTLEQTSVSQRVYHSIRVQRTLGARDALQNFCDTTNDRLLPHRGG